MTGSHDEIAMMSALLESHKEVKTLCIKNTIMTGALFRISKFVEGHAELTDEAVIAKEALENMRSVTDGVFGVVKIIETLKKDLP